MKGDSKCSVISAIIHSGRGTPGEDEKRGQAAIRWAWMTLACTDAPSVGSRMGCREHWGKEDILQPQPHEQKWGAICYTRHHLKTEIKSKLSFADKQSTKLVMIQGWESSFLSLCLVPIQFLLSLPQERGAVCSMRQSCWEDRQYTQNWKRQEKV